MEVICSISDCYQYIYMFITQTLNIDFKYLLDIYLWGRIQQKYIQSIYASTYNWFYGLLFASNDNIQIAHRIQYIEYTDEIKNIVDISSYLDNDHITLMDIHQAIINHKNEKINMINGCIEILYTLGDQEYVFTFPIYISDPHFLKKNQTQSVVATPECGEAPLVSRDSCEIDEDNFNSESITDTKIFPMKLINSSLCDYEFAEFKLIEKKSRRMSEHNLPGLLKKYSGPNNDFYFNHEIKTLNHNYDLVRHTYQLHKNMINLKLHPDISGEHDIVSISALRSDNADIDISKNNIIVKCLNPI